MKQTEIMEYTGIQKRVDGMGRIVIPKKMRLHLTAETDELEIHTEREWLYLCPHMQKAEGLCILRKFDVLGRISLPKEIRRTYHLEYETQLELYTKDNQIWMKKYQERCIFCNASLVGMTIYRGKPICKDCMIDLRKDFQQDKRETEWRK